MRASSEVLELDRTLAVFAANQIVGTAGIISYEMTVPGGASLPCAGVTEVTVQSTHRRHGFLRAMMRRQLDDIHERREPLAALYASEAPIYGRFGYGLATYQADIEVDRAHGTFRDTVRPAGQTTMVDVPSALRGFTRVWDEARVRQPGMLTMDERWWRYILADPEKGRGGASAQYLVVYQTGADPQGLARYRIKMSWSSEDEASGEVRVQFLIATTADAYAALWRYLLDIDLTTKVSAWMRPIEEPLRFLLADSREPRTRITDGLWLRLVDVERALGGRRYGCDGRLVVGVADEFCPWNAGSFELTAGPSGADCRRTTTSPDVELSVADLGAIYLGGNRVELLQRAGRVVEHRPGAVRLADRLFASDRAPWCPTHF